MLSTFNEYLDKQLKDPKFKAEYDELEIDFDIVHAIFDFYNSNNSNRRMLAEKSDLSERLISQLEAANANPSVKTLKKLAAAMGKKLHLEFQPI